MDRLLRRSWIRSPRSLRIALPVLIALLAVGGYLITSTTIRGDRDEAAVRRAQFESVQTQEVLGRARAYIAGLAKVLAGEREPGQSRFGRLAGGTAASVGLDDVLLVEEVPHSKRARYERRLGTPITRLTPAGRFERAPVANSYLPATFTSMTRPELHRGVDVSTFAGLGAEIRNRATTFAVSASKPGSIGGEPGFYLVAAAGFGSGPDRRGSLVAFVPRGWFTTTLEGDPRRVAISQDGRRVEGQLDSADAAATFETLGRGWRIDVAREPLSGLQSTLPWLALAWPFAVALIVFLVGRTIVLRRRAEREAEEMFERSTDFLSSAGFDGYFRRANPAFVRTLGYSNEELLSRPWTDFVHPDDVERSREAFAGIVHGQEVIGFENRYVCADGSARWIQWNVRPDVDEQVIYSVGRDVTESRRAEREFEEIFNLSPDLICIAGFDGYFKRINPALQEAFGYSSEELLSRPVVEFGHPDDVPMSLEMFERLTRGETVPRFENRNIRADGSLLWLEWSAQSLPEERTIYAAARDITERKSSEEQLRQAQETVEASRAELAVYAEDQAALRRVATLVARGAYPTEVLDAVATEVSGLLETDITGLMRYDPDGSATILAIRSDLAPPTLVGRRVPAEGQSFTASALRAGRPVRLEEDADAASPAASRAREMGFRSGVGAPITVEGRLWGGVFAAWTKEEPPLADAEGRMAQFTELVATAIANAESRGELHLRVEQQAALRRMATLVVRGVPPDEIFSAVAEELRPLFDADIATVARFEEDRTIAVLVGQAQAPGAPPLPTRWEVAPPLATAEVARTGRPARADGHDVSDASSETAEAMRRMGVRSAVASPIIVEGDLWGVITVSTKTDPLPPDAVDRVTDFTDLIATAIANAKSRAELDASRARVVAASAEERRRVVRDLHDGAQQRLVHAVIMLKLALRELSNGDRKAEELVSEALAHAEQGNSELRELARGLLPGVLTSGGLPAAVDELALRSSLPVLTNVSLERLEPAIEATAYFVVSEALTNAVKHSRAKGAEVAAQVEDGVLLVEVSDDGVGGADPGQGSGLTGLRDRVEALGGSMEIASPAGGGTSLAARIPVDG